MALASSRFTWIALAAIAFLIAVPAPALAAWEVSSPPLPADASSGSLDAISCPAAADCTATGKYVPTSEPGVTQVLLDRWDGSAWTAGSAPVAAASSAWGNSVSCLGGGACVVVGGYEAAASGKQLPLALVSSAGGWTQQAVPLPAAAASAELFGVSCPSASACVAVGGFHPESEAADYWQPFLARWNGSAWSEETPPLPANGNGGLLNHVSCPTAASCVAVGSYSNLKPSGERQEKGSLIEQWDGSDWTASHIGAESSDTLLSSISCPSAGNCITLTRPGVAWRLAGGSWSEIASPASEAKFEILDGACFALSSCVAVGVEYTSSGLYYSFGSEWNGSVWDSTGLGLQGGFIEGLLGASCPEARSCIAVGASLGASGETPLAAHLVAGA